MESTGVQSVNKARLLALLPKLRNTEIAVVGDLFLDEYIVGKATRLSREAPVPILEYDRDFDLPGAAAHPARNIRAMGGEVSVIGVVGDDVKAARLREHLSNAGIDISGLVTDSSRPTVTKSRVIAEDSTRIRQQIVRIDRLDHRPLSDPIARELAGHLLRAGSNANAIILSDYKSGVICSEVVVAARQLAAGGRLIAVDSQGDLLTFRGLTVVKVNQQEAEAALQCKLSDEASLAAAAAQLLSELSAEGVIITRGIDGMSVASRQMYAHIPAANRSEVFDVTGAGDTVIAILTLAMAAGGSLLDAAFLANIAAGLVVRKLGNATTSITELREIIERSTTIVDLDFAKRS